ncbi:MAG: hypothetical protein AB7D01_03595 [Methanoculleus sp.]
MAHTITVTDVWPDPDVTPRTYTAPTLPGLIREVLLAEFDISPIDLDLAPDEFPFEITECWRVPTVPALRIALDHFANLEHTY